MKNIKLFLILLLAVVTVSCGSSSGSGAVGQAERIPIQHNGRIKPFDSFARNTVKLVTASGRWQKKPAAVFLSEALSDPSSLLAEKWIRVDLDELKEKLSLPKDRHYFSYEEIAAEQGALVGLVQSSKAKRDKDLRPSLVEQKAELLYTRYRTVEELGSGHAITVIPSPDPQAGWLSPYHTQPPFMPDFKALAASFTKDKAAFEKNAGEWNKLVSRVSTEASPIKIELEVQYHKLRPFELAAGFYFLAFLLFVFFKQPRLGIIATVAALLFHTTGLALRVLILSRPPVSNMYESMIFMNWALVVFALIFSAVKKNTPALVVGSIVSGLVMIYADLLPIDSSLDVLVPVLRSNYWLTIHVMTIVSSYGAYGLAMGLGHRHLFNAKFKKFTKKTEKESADLIYKIIQLGTLLIGIGTVLGGVWANESWGRFWGWDPKETWALITFLGYLIVVHLKFAKKIDDTQLAVSAILGFLLVLMTWYGVNFVLGRGLHSYGAGTGGMQWVIYYLLFEAAFLGFILRPSKRRFF